MVRLLLIWLALAAAAARPSTPVDLNWLTGDWIMEEDGRWTREQWGEQRGVEIIGSSKSGIGRKTDFEETMRIAPDAAGVLTFWARPSKARDETPFRRNHTNILGNWIFENPANDYPQRVIYRREGGWLFAEIMQLDGSRTKSFVYRLAHPRKSAREDLPNIEQVEDAVSFGRRCVDEHGFTNCLPPMRLHVRNLVCWPQADQAGYIEPYRSAPAAECSFESRSTPYAQSTQNHEGTRWRADWAWLHFLETNDCSPTACKRDWILPRD